MIRLDGVSMTYSGGVRALEPTDLRFRGGEFTVLLGQSGAGKSTLLRCLNLLNRPTTGRVVIDDGTTLRPGRVLRKHRRQTAMVFQMHQLILRQTALRNVLVGRLAYHATWRTLLPMPEYEVERALSCLNRVDLLHKALTRCDQLSGGERQRVGIARALAQRPRYLLADEPVASLDPGTANKVLSLLDRVCAEDRITAIVSLHQVELAFRYADRIVGLADGRVVFDGTPNELTDHHLKVIYHGAPPAVEVEVETAAATPHRATPDEAPDPYEAAKRNGRQHPSSQSKEIEHDIAAINR